jgi:hypothetical protein
MSRAEKRLPPEGVAVGVDTAPAVARRASWGLGTGGRGLDKIAGIFRERLVGNLGRSRGQLGIVRREGVGCRAIRN